MRPLEVVLLAGAVIGVAWALTPWRRSRVVAAAVVLVGVGAVVVQAAAEGVRWQLIPLQAAVLTVAACGLAVIVRGRPAPAGRIFALGAGMLALAGGASAWALPLDVLPAPGGLHPIGTTTVTLTDPDRVERLGPAPGQPRKIVAQVWYPAHPETPQQPGPMVADIDAFAPAAAPELGLPTFVVRHLGSVPAHATADAEPVQSVAPQRVVIYSHGWRGFRAIHVNLLEDLASRGYLVIALDHTHASLATVFEDGKVAKLDPHALSTDADANVQAFERQRLVATFAEDIELALEALANGDIPAVSPEADLDQVALVGHATGGAAALLTCARTDRCGAVVAFDPWVDALPDEVIGAGLTMPLLSIRSEEWAAEPGDRRLRRLHAATEAPEGRVELRGATHEDFTVTPLLSPVAGAVGLSGKTPTELCHRIVLEWTRRFLDYHVRDTGTDPLRFSPIYPESELANAAG